MFFQEADNFHYESTILTMMAMVLISCLNHIAYTYNLLLLLIVRMHVCICSGRNAFASSCCCFEIEMGELASVSTIYCCISGDFNFYLSLIEHKIMHMFISFWYQSFTFQEDGKSYYILLINNFSIRFEDIDTRASEIFHLDLLLLLLCCVLFVFI